MRFVFAKRAIQIRARYCRKHQFGRTEDYREATIIVCCPNKIAYVKTADRAGDEFERAIELAGFISFLSAKKSETASFCHQAPPLPHDESGFPKYAQGDNRQKPFRFL